MNEALRTGRRSLARELSRIADASVAQSLMHLRDATLVPAQRIGVTGPPGAGKSTLIGRLARLRSSTHKPLAVIAIDPTSPKTCGSLLGDRIRMDAQLAGTDVYVRSLPSGRSVDGLSDNLADVLAAVEAHAFAEVIVETVGVGQAEYGVRTLVDTLVLVLGPNSGDQVQAMKAGILEMADIVVINKADQPGAERMALDIRTVLHRRGARDNQRQPTVLLTGASDDQSIAALSDAIDQHAASLAPVADNALNHRKRAVFHAQALLHRRVAEIVSEADGESLPNGVPALYRWLTARLSETS